MLVTFRNATASPLYIHPIRLSVEAGGTRTARRTPGELDRDQVFKRHVEDGEIELAFEVELGDNAALGFGQTSLSYTDLTRPDAAAFPLYTPIWNSDAKAHQWSDGTHWRDAAGTIT